MPTSYANGVTATLATCNVSASLSKNITITQGAAHQKDLDRVHEVLSTACSLPERPIGEDGSEEGVLQFIGANSDMMLYVVEAGNRTDPSDDALVDSAVHNTPNADVQDTPNHHPAYSSDDSPLTSLVTTPTSIRQSLSGSPQHSPALPPSNAATIPRVANELSLKDKEDVMRNFKNPFEADARALVLDVCFSPKSFLPAFYQVLARPVRPGFFRGLQIETYMNGLLVDATLVNQDESRRTTSRALGKDKVRISGTRIHRTVEKPWIYSQASATDDQSSDSTCDAETRWSDVSASYCAEAETRGRNEHGDAPPSLDFLMALAELELPERLRAARGIAIIDVVITIGEGRKLGPQTAYVMEPARFEDLDYGYPASAVARLATPPVGGVQAQGHLAVQTPRPQGRLAAGLFSSAPDANKTSVGNDATALPSTGEEDSALRQKVRDLETNTAFQDQMKLDFEDFLAMSAKMSNIASNLPSTADPAAVLTEQRIDLAMHYGAASNGPLVRRIVATAPQRKPRMRTSASALANSPAHVPVKLPKPRGRDAVAPQRPTVDLNGSPMPNPMATSSAVPKAAVSSTHPSSSAKKLARRYHPGEQTIQEALRDFEIPEECESSCVSYDANENVARHIAKTRSGEFKEDAVLVGMRFVVV